MKKPHAFILPVWLLLGILCPSVTALSAPAQWSWSGVERIAAVGDIHGDYGRLVKVLLDAGIINNSQNWTAGKTHMVQLGDVPDRGPNPRRIMDFYMKLEKQAQKAGGYVHVLIGNHEAMNIYGDLRYVTAQAFEEFKNADSERVREAYYSRVVEELRSKAEGTDTPIVVDGVFRKNWEAGHPLGWVEHRYAHGPNGQYGRWIRGHNAVIRINDTLFLHGGIGPKYADITPEVINEAIRKELDDVSSISGGIATDVEGPLWYRGLALEDEKDLALHVDAVLKNFGVERVVVGHTPTRTAVIPRFGCKVIQADVGLSAAYGGPPAALVIEKGTAYALHRGKMLRIPCDSGAELLAYLRRAAALDPQPSPLEGMIEELEKKLSERVP